MMVQLLFVYCTFLLCNLVLSGDLEKFIVPDVTIEALKNGSFRAYIPDSKGLKFFAFHAKLNTPLVMQDPGDYSMEISEKTGDFWIATFPNAHAKAGDRIYFWIFCHVNRLGYGRDSLNTTISDLLDEYPTLQSRCVTSATTINGQNVCVGEVMLDEQFTDSSIDGNNWIVEHWIPTYTPPSFIFNSYVNKAETRFITNGILHLKPIAFQNDADVRGVLDLRNGCTSKTEGQCYFRSKSWSLLPPVQSAKITTKKSFKYGNIDVRAKLPAGEWLIPVIRLEQKTKEAGENSPVVWIAYSRGNENLNGNGEDLGSHIVFAGPVLHQSEPDRSKHLSSRRSATSFYQEFHTYSVGWKPGKMTFSIDNVEYGSVELGRSLVQDVDVRSTWTAPESPYNVEYVLTLGVAVGGLTDFPDGYESGNNAKPWSNTEPGFIRNFFQQRAVWSNTWNLNSAELQVDYVKITAV